MTFSGIPSRAAVMGDRHHHRAQRRGIAPEQIAFDHAADVAGQQERPVRGFHAQHAAGFVAQVGKMRRRMQESEEHVVPNPGGSGATIAEAGDAASETAAFGRVAATDLERLRHRRESAGVIVVAMADHRRVQPAHAERAERRHHRTLAGVEPFRDRRPHVEQQLVALGPDQHR